MVLRSFIVTQCGGHNIPILVAPTATTTIRQQQEQPQLRRSKLAPESAPWPSQPSELESMGDKDFKRPNAKLI